jgi:hypothetical protein
MPWKQYVRRNDDGWAAALVVAAVRLRRLHGCGETEVLG